MLVGADSTAARGASGWMDGCARGVQCATICLGCMVIKDGCSKVRVYKEVGDEAFPVRCTDWFDPTPRTHGPVSSRCGGIHGYRESYWDSRKSARGCRSDPYCVVHHVKPQQYERPLDDYRIARLTKLNQKVPRRTGAVLMLCAPSIGSLRTANGHAAAPRRRADPCVHVRAVCPHRSSVARAAHRGCAVR